MLDFFVRTGWPLKKIKCTDTWHRNFMSRHPEVSARITHSSVWDKSTQWTKEMADKWSQQLEELANEGYLKNPTSIWNLDESGFFLDHDFDRVYARKGTKNVYSHHDGDIKERMTVLACGNAAGVMLRPFVLYDGKVQLLSRLKGNREQVFCVGINRSGWMDNRNFTSYCVKELFAAMTSEKVSDRLTD